MPALQVDEGMRSTQHIRAALTGTPEHLAGYLNSRAAADIRWLLDELDAERERNALLRTEVMDIERVLRTYDDRGVR